MLCLPVGRGRVHDWLAEGNMTSLLLLGSWHFLSATMWSSGQTTHYAILEPPAAIDSHARVALDGQGGGSVRPYLYSFLNAPTLVNSIQEMIERGDPGAHPRLREAFAPELFKSTGSAQYSAIPDGVV